MYARGQGIKQDYSKALELGTKAANSGHVMSMLNLGRMYETGTGISQDKERAVFYYRKASEKGNYVATKLLQHLEEEMRKFQEFSNNAAEASTVHEKNVASQ